MEVRKRSGARTIAIGAAVAMMISCAGDMADDGMGSVGMDLQIGPGVTVNTVNYAIKNETTGFNRASTINVRFSNTVSFLAGAIPPATGYTLALTATSVDGAFTCAGMAGFDITAGVSTPVALTLTCSTASPGQGTVVVTGTTQICANLDSISAAPLETAVNTPIALSATASAGTLTPTFAWTATAGTFDNAASATPVFTCPATPGPVVITVTASPSATTCPNTFARSVPVTCDAVNPTFTNIYANLITGRCTGCHRPGGSGVNVGMLDMSTPAAAYANLVGVNAQGVGAGTSGITCASVSPPLVRVIPGNPTDSLLFNKVHSKLVGTLAPCGSPMPLGGGAPLNAADNDLISAWIAAGALNN
jgi:hypothetical protein